MNLIQTFINKVNAAIEDWIKDAEIYHKYSHLDSCDAWIHVDLPNHHIKVIENADTVFARDDDTRYITELSFVLPDDNGDPVVVDVKIIEVGNLTCPGVCFVVDNFLRDHANDIANFWARVTIDDKAKTYININDYLGD